MDSQHRRRQPSGHCIPVSPLSGTQYGAHSSVANSSYYGPGSGFGSGKPPEPYPSRQSSYMPNLRQQPHGRNNSVDQVSCDYSLSQEPSSSRDTLPLRGLGFNQRDPSTSGITNATDYGNSGSFMSNLQTGATAMGAALSVSSSPWSLYVTTPALTATYTQGIDTSQLLGYNVLPTQNQYSNSLYPPQQAQIDGTNIITHPNGSIPLMPDPSLWPRDTGYVQGQNNVIGGRLDSRSSRDIASVSTQRHTSQRPRDEKTPLGTHGLPPHGASMLLPSSTNVHPANDLGPKPHRTSRSRKHRPKQDNAKKGRSRNLTVEERAHAEAVRKSPTGACDSCRKKKTKARSLVRPSATMQTF